MPPYIKHNRDGGIGTFATHKHGRSPLRLAGRIKFTSAEGYIG
jgi:hypothetical protein